MERTVPYRVTVYGRPEPGGSKKGFVNRRTGAVIITDANAKVKPWREEVARCARLVGSPLFDGPLFLTVRFFLARPKGHFGTGRNSDRLKESAPQFPTVKPDVTKLLRAVEDALTGIAWADDSRVVYQMATKEYGAVERCEISVSPMSLTGAV